MNYSEILSPALFEIFISETSDQIDRINNALLKLESEGVAPFALSEIFRAVHSIKSSAASACLSELTSIAHHFENILELIKDSNYKIDPDIFEVLFRATDFMRVLLMATKGGIKIQPKEYDSLIISMEEIVQKIQQKGGCKKNKLSFKLTDVNELDNFKHIYIIKLEIRPDARMREVKAYLIMLGIEKHGKIIDSIPSIDEIKRAYLILICNFWRRQMNP